MTVPTFQEVRIENTNACGYKCVMCPREKQTRQIGYMPMDDFSLVLDRIGSFDGSFHLHGFGEPLLDRSFIGKIELLKKKSPKAHATIFSTLGVKLRDDYFLKLAGSELDQMVVSLYGVTQENYARVHGFDGFERVKANLQQLSSAIKETASSLQVSVKMPSPNFSSPLPVAFPPETLSFYKWIEDLGLNIGFWPGAHNYGNGRGFNAPGDHVLCPVIEGKRKNILNVTWDLHVIPCCFDFNASIQFGNLRNQTLEEIFSGPQYLKFVIAHRTDDLSGYSACQTCEKWDAQ